ncbi:MAG: bifunctional DNA primase/polymerase [Pseudonocardiaceae bacterium]
MDLSTQHPSRWATSAIKNAAEAGHLPTAAATLAKAGIPVFPCVPGSKQPLTAHGFQSASADASQVNRWWRRAPEANVGIPTGAASGLVVVDVDIHRSGDGFRAFSTAMEFGLTQRWAWMVRTPSGGMHAYFAATPGVEQRNWSLPSRHIDFRGDGGYIVAPPSRVATSGGTERPYSLVGFGHRPGTVDSVALNHHLAPPPPPQRAPSTLPVMGSSPERLAAWVARRPEGARNGGLFWAACRMAEGGHDFSQAARILGDAASTAGLPDVEAFKTIKSAYNTARRLGPTTTAPTARTTDGVAM